MKINFIPKTLSGQMTVLIILTIIISQVISAVFFIKERSHALSAIGHEELFEHIHTTVRLLNNAPVESHKQLLITASSPKLQFWFSTNNIVDKTNQNQLSKELQSVLASHGVKKVFIDQNSSYKFKRYKYKYYKQKDDDDDDDDDYKYQQLSFKDKKYKSSNLLVSLKLDNNKWLNAKSRLSFIPPSWIISNLLSILLTAIALVIVVALAVRRISSPLKKLADAADELGKGKEVQPLTETGPKEMRLTSRSFNIMNERLSRFVKDRTILLAAISHDLRTPITTMRLRAELLDDKKLRNSFLKTLDEMQTMADATLAFVREESTQENTSTIDVCALVQSLCDDMIEANYKVKLASCEPCFLSCRPIGLKRAITNLIENAIKYGNNAIVTVVENKISVKIIVDDHGPGILEKEMENIFAPFVRLETSRNKDSDGVGLGLAITRSIVRAHGGDVTLKNRPEGGLRAIINIPK